MPVPKEQVVAVLRDSVAAVEAAEVPKDLRPIAFSKAFDQIAGIPATAAPGGSGTGNGESGGGGAAPSDAIGRIAAKLGIEAEIVERVFDVDQDGVHLTVPRSALNDAKKFAMQEIARLIAAARQ